MLKNTFLLKLHYFYVPFTIAYVADLKGVLPLLFLEAQALCNTTQNIFPSDQKQKEKRRYMIYQGLFDLGHLYDVILCITFVGLQYLNPEISKLQSLDLFPDHLQTPTFQIISFLEFGHSTL